MYRQKNSDFLLSKLKSSSDRKKQRSKGQPRPQGSLESNSITEERTHNLPLKASSMFKSLEERVQGKAQEPLELLELSDLDSVMRVIDECMAEAGREIKRLLEQLDQAAAENSALRGRVRGLEEGEKAREESLLRASRKAERSSISREEKRMFQTLEKLRNENLLLKKEVQTLKIENKRLVERLGEERMSSLLGPLEQSQEEPKKRAQSNQSNKRYKFLKPRPDE